MLLARLGLPSLRGQLPFVAAILVDTLGTGLFLPVSLLYFTQVADLPLAVAGPLVSGATAVSLPLPAVVGALVDRFGARRVVIVGQLLQSAGMAGYLVFARRGCCSSPRCWWPPGSGRSGRPSSPWSPTWPTRRSGTAGTG